MARRKQRVSWFFYIYYSFQHHVLLSQEKLTAKKAVSCITLQERSAGSGARSRIIDQPAFAGAGGLRLKPRGDEADFYMRLSGGAVPTVKEESEEMSDVDYERYCDEHTVLYAVQGAALAELAAGSSLQVIVCVWV